MGKEYKKDPVYMQLVRLQVSWIRNVLGSVKQVLEDSGLKRTKSMRWSLWVAPYVSQKCHSSSRSLLTGRSQTVVSNQMKLRHMAAMQAGILSGVGAKVD